MRKPFIALLLLTAGAHAQKVEKTVTFRYSDHKKTTLAPGIVAIGTHSNHQGVTVYGWHRHIGDLRTEAAGAKAAPEPKKGSKLFGKLLSVATSVESFSGNDRPAGPPTVPMLSVRSFDPQSLDVTQQSAEFISPLPLNPAQKVSYTSTYASDSDRPAGGVITTDLVGATTKYPLLFGNNTARQARLSNQGEGGLFGKTLNGSFLLTNHAAPLVVGQDGLLTSATGSASKQEQNIEELSGLWPMGILLTSPDKKQAVALTHRKSNDDSWAMYKQFSAVTFDEHGTALKRVELAHDYVRDVSSYGYVYNETGQPTGVYFVFTALTSGAGKKHRDPVENRVNFVHLGFDGTVRHKLAFEHGNPEKSRGFNPILIIEKGDQLDVLSWNADKIFARVLEVVVLNPQGKVSARTIDVPKSVPGAFVPSSSNTSANVNTLFVNNLIFITEQSRTLTPGAAPAFGTEVLIGAFKPDFTPVSARRVMTVASGIPAQIEAISGAAPRLLATLPDENVFISADNALNVTTVTPKGARMPNSPAMVRNYVHVPEQQKVYFVYETPVSGEGKLVAVSL